MGRFSLSWLENGDWALGLLSKPLFPLSPRHLRDQSTDLISVNGVTLGQLPRLRAQGINHAFPRLSSAREPSRETFRGAQSSACQTKMQQILGPNL